MKKRVPKRSPETVQISITLPVALLDAIDDLAEAQDRNRSNLIAVILKSAVNNLPAQQGVPPPPPLARAISKQGKDK